MKLISIIFLSFLFSCATTTKTRTVIISHPAYIALPNDDKDIADEIMNKADRKTNTTYYYSKLFLLLNTPQEPFYGSYYFPLAEIKIIKRKRAQAAAELGISVEEYVNKEEAYEIEKSREWAEQCPTYFGPCFMVAREDPKDILINIKVHLTGTPELIKYTMALEDDIEKHLSINGFNVNLVFVGYVNDAFDIKIDPTQWPESHNWIGSGYILAHELMHLLGAADEYDYIENHADNKYLPVSDKLSLFIRQMDVILPPDAKLGIMSSSDLRPLQRHCCFVSGLSKKCVEIRTEKYGK